MNAVFHFGTEPITINAEDAPYFGWQKMDPLDKNKERPDRRRHDVWAHGFVGKHRFFLVDLFFLQSDSVRLCHFIPSVIAVLTCVLIVL